MGPSSCRTRPAEVACEYHAARKSNSIRQLGAQVRRLCRRPPAESGVEIVSVKRLHREMNRVMEEGAETLSEDLPAPRYGRLFTQMPLTGIDAVASHSLPGTVGNTESPAASSEGHFSWMMLTLWPENHPKCTVRRHKLQVLESSLNSSSGPDGGLIWSGIRHPG